MDTETKQEFNKVRQEFKQIHQKFKQVDRRFEDLKLFMMNNFVTHAQFEERFALVATKQDISDVINLIDGYSKQMKDRDEEAIIAAYRTKRLETWAGEVGSKIGVQYDP